MLFGFSGWYPIAYSSLQNLPKLPRVLVKLALFNLSTIAIEAVVMLLLVPETMGAGWMIGLLVLGNLVFIMYDRLIPQSALLLRRITSIL